MTTLAKYFADLRATAELSYSEVAAKCKVGSKKLSRHVIWKIENGKPIKADTLAIVLKKGLGIPEDDEAYIEAFAHWSAAQSKTSTAPDVQKAIAALQLKGNAHFKAFAVELVSLASKVADEDLPAVLEALRHVPALKLWLQSRK
jgi:transcriptional regulator with XRE-family HTH domain